MLTISFPINDLSHLHIMESQTFLWDTRLKDPLRGSTVTLSKKWTEIRTIQSEQKSGHFIVNTNPDILLREQKSGHFNRVNWNWIFAIYCQSRGYLGLQTISKPSFGHAWATCKVLSKLVVRFLRYKGTTSRRTFIYYY